MTGSSPGVSTLIPASLLQPRLAECRRVAGIYWRIELVAPRPHNDLMMQRDVDDVVEHDPPYLLDHRGRADPRHVAASDSRRRARGDPGGGRDRGRAVCCVSRDHTGVRQARRPENRAGLRRAVQGGLAGCRAARIWSSCSVPWRRRRTRRFTSGARGTNPSSRPSSRPATWTAATRLPAAAPWCGSTTPAGTRDLRRSQAADGQRRSRASSGVSAVIDSAWMSVCMRSPSAANTRR